MSSVVAPPPRTQQQPGAAVPVVVVAQRGNGLGTTGFVLSLIGAIFGLIPLLFWLAFPLGILGLIFASIGWRHSITEPARGGKGLSIAGTILGVVAIGLAILGATIISSL